MKIGEAARRTGVAAHVLRHWHASGVVVPDRTASGHREYTEEHLRRAHVVRACQGVGMSLPEIRAVLTRDDAGRAEVIGARLLRIRAQRAGLEAAERFLEHVIGCTHDLLTRCEACTEYARTSPHAATGGAPAGRPAADGA